MTREEIQTLLEEILGSTNVYYQPPAGVKMKYPAIVYERTNFSNNPANNAVYKQKIRYKVTVIDKKPDNPAIAKLSRRMLCSFDTHYVSDGLNHDVFSLFN